jgi:broad specificity phosphatase PhoE
MQLFLVRHGQSLYNMEQRHQGWLDIALSPLGEQQAGRIAERLKQQPFDYIFSSPIKRCYDTCAAIVQAQGRPLSDIQVLQDLKEARLSAALEGKLEKEIFKSWSKEQREAFRDDYNFKLEDGESVKEVIERTITAYKYIASLSEAAPPDPEEELNEEVAAATSAEPEPKPEKTPQPKPKPKTALVVAHRIQVQLLTLLTLDAVEILAREQTLIDRVEISNCSLTVLNVNVKGKRPLYQLLTMNDINHLAGLSTPVPAPPPATSEASTTTTQ